MDYIKHIPLVVCMQKIMRTMILLIAMVGLMNMVSFAERLYQWTDKSGVTHLTQHPPPSEGQLQDVMDYRNSDRVSPSAERETLQSDTETETAPAPAATLTTPKEKVIKEAVEANKYCFLQAPDIDVYVRVWEPNSYGERGLKLWSGVIEKGQQQKVASRSGRVIYDFKKEVKGPFGGSKSSNCSGGGVIQLMR
jgi:hypothetical protein